MTQNDIFELSRIKDKMNSGNTDEVLLGLTLFYTSHFYNIFKQCANTDLLYFFNDEFPNNVFDGRNLLVYDLISIALQWKRFSIKQIAIFYNKRIDSILNPKLA